MALRVAICTLALLFLLLWRECATPVPITSSEPQHITPEGKLASHERSDFYTAYDDGENLDALISQMLQRDGDTLAYSLWNETVANESDARLACEEFSARKNATPAAPSQGSCHVEYECDYNPNRFPEILVSVECSYDFCSLDNSDSPSRIVRQCLATHRKVVVLVYEEPETATRISPYGEENDNVPSTTPISSQSRDTAPGTWFYNRVPVNYACVCAQ